MSADHLTKAEMTILEGWGNLYARLEARLDRMSDDELGKLYGALHATTQTNCWYAIHRAAQALKPIVEGKCGERTMQKLEAMDAGSVNSSQ